MDRGPHCGWGEGEEIALPCMQCELLFREYMYIFVNNIWRLHVFVTVSLPLCVPMDKHRSLLTVSSRDLDPVT